MSFDKRVAYYKKWRYVFISILLTALIFIPWDIYFTQREIWGFNSKFLLGISIFGLPLEENLFFLAVPFACIFIFECVKYYLKGIVRKLDHYLNWYWLIAFTIICLSFIFSFSDKLYTVVVTSFALVTVIALSLFARNYMSIAIVSFVIIGLPFFIINGALTGMFTAEPVVWYNEFGISNIRIGTIPIEDFFYNILLVASSFTFYLGWQRLVLKKPIDL